MKKLLKELFVAYPDKLQIVLLMIVITGLGLLQPLFHGVFLDMVHSGSALLEVLCFCSVIIGSELISLGLGYVLSVKQINAETEFSESIRARVWNHLGVIPMQILFRESPGVWMQKVSGDTELVCGTFRVLLFSTVQFSLFLAGTVAIVLWKNPAMVLLFVAVAIFGVAFHKTFEKRISHRSERLRKGMYAYNTAIYDLFLMQPLLRMFGLMNLFSGRFASRNRMAAKQNAALQLVSMRYGSVLSLEMALVHGCTFVLCISLYYSGSISFGDIWVYDMLVSQLTGGVNRFLEMLPQLDRGREAGKSISETLGIEKEEPAKQRRNCRTGVVEICNLAFKYDNAEVDILADCSIRIKKGEIVGIFGKNGSGKSTLIQLILGNLKPARGNVSIGTDKVALVPQHIAVFRGSILENVRLFDKGIGEEHVVGVLRRCGLGNWVDNCKDGIRGKISQEVVSGGELQRLAIARALVRNPELLVVDEVSNNLDVIEKGRVLDILLSARESMTVISVTHDLDVADKYDRVCVLSQGRLNELAKTPDVSSIDRIRAVLKDDC